MRTIAHPAHAPGKALIVYAAAIFALLAIASDLYLPALPALREALQATDAQAQLTLSAFVIGFGVAQLVYGPLSDRFGRRPVLLGGLALFMAGSIASMLAPTIEALVAARLLQGVGACSGPVVARAIVRDLYDPLRGARALAHIMMLVGLVPMFAPLVGGTITVWLGWRANFAVLLAYGVAVFAVSWVVLAESSRHLDRTATNVAQLARNANAIYANPTFSAYAVCFTLSYAGLFLYLSGSPFLMIEVFGLSPREFGLWWIMPVVGHFFGSYVCAHLTRRFSLKTLLGIGAGATAFGGALMLGLAGFAHPLAIVVPMTFYLIGHSFTNPVCLAAAVGPFPKIAGTASALLGCTQLVLAAVVGQVFMRAFAGTQLALAGGIALFACGLFAAYLALVRRPGRA